MKNKTFARGETSCSNNFANLYVWKYLAIGVGITAALVFLFAASASPSKAEGSVSSGVENGQYLADAGNCASCHTREGGESYTGGLAFETPFGTIYSTNISSDSDTGIGEWTLDEFATALREGERPNGEHLYPVFPYVSFSKLSDEDIAALFDFFQTVPSVSYTPPENDLGFPYSKRSMLGMWKSMYFDGERFEPDPVQSQEWNRGAYLVEGLGHCGMCHTPRNYLGASDDDLAMTGATYKDKIDGKLLNWSSTNLTQSTSGLASWSAEDIVSYLQHGISPQAGVFGPMNEVVVNSTMKLTQQDLTAVATYLKSLPANEQKKGSAPDEETMRLGSIQYDIHCGTCHLPTGLGSDMTGPTLVGSSVTLSPDPASLINITLYGAQVPHVAPSDKWQARDWKLMGDFENLLDDEQAAAVLSFVRNAWGNSAGEVTVEQIEQQR
jgi:mono/diheme cytochrome c family protein